MVYHYNNLDTLNVTAIKNSSYHETGSVVNVANLTAGRIVVENGGYIKEVALASTATNDTAAVVVNGYVGTVDSSAIAEESNKVTATGSGYVVHNGSDEAASMGTATSVETAITTLSQLHEFRDRVNGGQDYTGLTVKLGADLDLTGVVWTPIGNSNNPFSGTFDGQNHTIKGLTNAGYEATADNATFTTSTSNSSGYAYGLFGIIGHKTNNTAAVTLKNLIFTEVNIDAPQSNMCGALVGADVKAAKSTSGTINSNYTGDITISNIRVSGSIKALDSVAGVVGKIYSKGATNISNCSNSADITILGTNQKKGAGILGFISTAGSLTLTGCSNSGNISYANSLVELENIAGIVIAMLTSSNHITVTGNTNTGTIQTIDRGASIVFAMGYAVSTASSLVVNNNTCSANDGYNCAYGLDGNGGSGSTYPNA